MKVQESPQAFCPTCGSPTRPGQNFCRACGSQTAQIAPTDPMQLVFCGQCGAALNKTWKFCFVCASPLLNVPVLLQTGYMLDKRYEVVQVLGQGGMGAVYKAMDTRFSKRPFVAIKELNRDGLNTTELSDALEQFKREADLLRSLQHPNLPRMHDHFVEQGKPYLVMDFVEGETLEVTLQKQGRRFQEDQVLKIGKDLCAVLSYLHAQYPPIIFRDLKPSNIMLTSAEQVYLIDFGIARHFKPGQAKDTVAWGSAGYAAPEQFGRAQTDVRSDEYSLGVVLYELLTGDDPTALVFMQGRLSVGQVSHTARWERLIDTMCSMNASTRYSSLTDVLKELTAMEAGSVNARVSSARVTSLQTARAKEVALFYNRVDDGLAKELAIHLRTGQRSSGLDFTIQHNIEQAGGSGLIAEAWERRMHADIVVLLVSADFVADDNLWKRGNELINRRPDHIIVVQLRPMVLDQGKYHGHAVIPAQAITLYSKKENAWLEVVNEILKKVVAESRQHLSLPSAAPSQVSLPPPIKPQRKQTVLSAVSPPLSAQPVVPISRTWEMTILSAPEDERWRERFVTELLGMQQDTLLETGIQFDIHEEDITAADITRVIAHSQMTFLLLSPHFIASPWMDQYEHLKAAANQVGQTLIPIWLLDCEWSMIQTTPRKPIEDLGNDSAWKEVAEEILKLLRTWYPQEIPQRSHLALPSTVKLDMPSGSDWQLAVLTTKKEKEWIKVLETYLAAFRRSLQAERGITLTCQEAVWAGTEEGLFQLLTDARLVIPLVSPDFRASKWMLQYPTVKALLQSRMQYPCAVGIRECMWDHGQVPFKAIGSRNNTSVLVEVVRVIQSRLQEYYPYELPQKKTSQW